MHPYRDSIITRIALVVLFIIILIYAYYEARGIFYGPTIDISAPTETVTTQYVLISGHADRITSLTINGSPVSVTLDGDFKEPYVLQPGTNEITLDASDTYGHTTKKKIEIVFVPEQVAVQSASSSDATATSSYETATTSMAASSTLLAPSR